MGRAEQMQVIERNTNDLKPYENNPRINKKAIDYVANSIKEFGFKVPIVIDSNDVIVCGHTRLEAAMKLGMQTVPCILADDLTDEQIKAYRLADNKTAEFAGWKTKLLNEELKELGSFDVELFGFAQPLSNEDLKEKNDNPEKEIKMVKCPHCGMMHEAKKVKVKYD